MNRLQYELEPEDVDEFEFEDEFTEDDGYELPDDGYRWYEAEVTEKVTKIVRILAKDEESAKTYLEDNISEIDMEKNIDEFTRSVTLVEETDPVDVDFKVPEEMYE